MIGRFSLDIRYSFVDIYRGMVVVLHTNEYAQMPQGLYHHVPFACVCCDVTQQPPVLTKYNEVIK